MEPRPAASVRARELGYRGALPRGFDAWFARCTDADPTRRFAEGRAATDALLAVLDGVPASASPPRHPEASGYGPTAWATPPPNVSPTAPVTPSRSGGRLLLLGGIGLVVVALASIAALGATLIVASDDRDAPVQEMLAAQASDAGVPSCEGTFRCPVPERSLCQLGRCVESTNVASGSLTFADGTELVFDVAYFVQIRFSLSDASYLHIAFGRGNIVLMVSLPPDGVVAGTTPLAPHGLAQSDHPERTELSVDIRDEPGIRGERRGRYERSRGTVTYEHVDYDYGGAFDGSLTAELTGGGAAERAPLQVSLRFHVEIPE